jgi:hypothetical protein
MLMMTANKRRVCLVRHSFLCPREREREPDVLNTFKDRFVVVVVVLANGIF